MDKTTALFALSAMRVPDPPAVLARAEADLAATLAPGLVLAGWYEAGNCRWAFDLVRLP